MSRRDELLKYLGGKDNGAMIEPMVDEVVFLEQRLTELRKLPFLRVHPHNPEIQKATPASRMYVSLMAQYNANIRTLARLSGKIEVEEESPLRSWVKNQPTLNRIETTAQPVIPPPPEGECYICDPVKNVSCKKGASCQTVCFHTTNRAYAVENAELGEKSCW
jgi:hypothetical protein